MPIARSTLTGVVSGVVLLAGVAGFGIGLPKATGDEGPTASLPTLPDRLDQRMVAVAALTPEDAGATDPNDKQLIEQFVTAADKGDADASKKFDELYGGGTVRLYIDGSVLATQGQQRPAQMSVSVVPGDAGLVIPNGPFPISQGGSRYELQEIDGHRCGVSWQEPTDPTTGQPTGGEVPASNYEAECRAQRDGLAYDVYASGLSPEEVAGYLDKVLELTA